ncbi:hypothetical protein NL676_030546 [Syzygium grande]|nr:hypothetical protein NL676_030546 [Syzygium grande]
MVLVVRDRRNEGEGNLFKPPPSPLQGTHQTVVTTALQMDSRISLLQQLRWPEDRDVEEGGEWTAQTIANPNTRVHGSQSSLKSILQTHFKDDPELYVFPILKYVGIELQQVKFGTLFANVLVCDDPEDAKKLAEETWGKNKDVCGFAPYKFYF